MARASWSRWLGGAMMMAAATGAAAEGVEVGAPDCRVRGVGTEARQLLKEAVRTSPTVGQLVEALQATDVIVNVELALLPKPLNGMIQIAAAAPGARYLRLTLRVPTGRPKAVATLGHELRHALEIAGMPEIKDEATLAQAYRRLGASGYREGAFETEAALETGRAVARELAAAHR
jgi:hypothetical protein